VIAYIRVLCASTNKKRTDDMKEEKPKSIKTIGTAIMVLSALIIFSNGMGALMSTLIGLGEASPSGQAFQTPIEFVFAHYLEMCLFMVAIGSAYLLGGLFIKKYKLLANRFLTVVSGVQVLIVWTIMLIIRTSFGQEPELQILNIWTIVVAITWTIPFGLLIWYLNKKDIVKHFE
jgi:hypothetical protein